MFGCVTVRTDHTSDNLKKKTDLTGREPGVLSTGRETNMEEEEVQRDGM